MGLGVSIPVEESFKRWEHLRVSCERVVLNKKNPLKFISS